MKACGPGPWSDEAGRMAFSKWYDFLPGGHLQTKALPYPACATLAGGLRDQLRPNPNPGFCL